MSNPTIKLKQGSVIGRKMELPKGGHMHIFQGIPYAKPPTGNLRFKSPVPLEKFSKDVIHCTKEGNMSVQRKLFTRENVGNEDCLYLNVYCPPIDWRQSVPVIFFIHGGVLSFGSGNSDL